MSTDCRKPTAASTAAKGNSYLQVLYFYRCFLPVHADTFLSLPQLDEGFSLHAACLLPSAMLLPDANACVQFKCASSVAICTDLPSPAPNSAAGRNCSCPIGRFYANDTIGCAGEHLLCRALPHWVLHRFLTVDPFLKYLTLSAADAHHSMTVQNG